MFIYVYIYIYIYIHIYIYIYIYIYRILPGGLVGKESACNARDLALIPGSGRSHEEGNGNPLQYPCLENSMDRGARQATLCGVALLFSHLVILKANC